MASPNEIAEVSVGVKADLSDLKRVGPEIRETFQDAGNVADNTGERIGGAFERAGKKIEDSTAGIRKFSGALSSTVGAITAVTGAVTGLAGVLLLLKNRHDAAQQASQQQTRAYHDLTRAIQDYEAEAVKSTEQVEESTFRVLRAIDAQNNTIERSRLDALAATVQQIEQEKLLEAQIVRTQQAAEKASKVELEARRTQAAAIRELVELLDQQRISLLPDDQKLKADAERQKRIIEETFSEIGVNLPEGLVDQALRNVDLITEKQLAAERERQRIADEAQAKREAEADRRNAERIRQIQEAMSSITSGDFVATLEAIPRALKEVSTGVRRLK
jgi:hypothetical protein